MEAVKYQIILPYSVVAALTSETHLTHETRGQCIRYDIDIPVWSSRLGWGSTLEQCLFDEAQPAVEKEHGKRIHDNIGMNTLKI